MKPDKQREEVREKMEIRGCLIGYTGKNLIGKFMGEDVVISCDIDDLAKQLTHSEARKILRIKKCNSKREKECPDCNDHYTCGKHTTNKFQPTEQKEFPKSFPISACCNSSVKVSGDDEEGTHYYICQACYRPCDLAEWNKPIPAEKEEEKVYTQHEMNEACRIRDLQITEAMGKEPEPKPKDRIEPIEYENVNLVDKINEIIHFINNRKE